MFGFTWLIIEALSFCAYPVIFGDWFSSLENYNHILQTSSQASLSQTNTNAYATTQIKDLIAGKQSVLHPYLGFVYNPDGWKTKHDGIPISNFGFIDDKSPIQKRSNDKVIIGIFGGSVAWWFQQLGAKEMINELKQLPQYANKEFVIVRTALGGFKQPQQLMTLTYLLSLGAEFDIIVNLDGYNEIALPYHHNISSGVNPFFPVNWKEQVTSILNRETLKIIANITRLEDHQKSVADFMLSTPILRHSIACSLLWRGYNAITSRNVLKLRQQLSNSNAEASNSAKKHIPFYISGPAFDYASKENLLTELTNIWKSSSMTMHSLCLQHKCAYFHFLQPNQYASDRKFMSEAERTIAIGLPDDMNQYIKDGYPLARNAGKELLSSGVHFTDLTTIFDETKEATYNDTCCHLSKTGNEILGKNIGTAIREHLK